MRTPNRRLAVLLAVLPLTLLLGVTPAAAQSAESLVVASVPDGFEPVPPGEENGPLDKATALELFNNEKDIRELFDEQDYKGGFIRTWTTSDRSSAVISSVFVFGEEVDAEDFLEGAKEVESGTETFDIPDVPNSVGLSTSQFQLASYAKKHQIFLTIVSGGEANRAQLIDVVKKHDAGPLAQLPEAEKDSLVENVIGGAILGAVIGLAVYLVRRALRRRSATSAAAPAWGGPQDAFGAPDGPGAAGYPPPPPPTAGSYPPPQDGDDAPYAPPPG